MVSEFINTEMIGFWRGAGKDKWESIFQAPAFSTKHFFLSHTYFQKVVAICIGEKSAGDPMKNEAVLCEIPASWEREVERQWEQVGQIHLNVE